MQGVQGVLQAVLVDIDDGLHTDECAVRLAFKDRAGRDEFTAFQDDVETDGIGIGLQEFPGDQFLHAGTDSVHPGVGRRDLLVFPFGGNTVLDSKCRTDSKERDQYSSKKTG